MSEWHLTSGWRECDRAAVVALLREYEAAIGTSLSFQGFEAELAGLPGDYAPPKGGLLMARAPGGAELLGCVAVRPLPNSTDLCEMKRLFVRPAAQGSGLGRALAAAAITEARRLGYARLCLDTLPTMAAAQALYRSMGFRETGTSGSDPVVLLFERDLRRTR